MAAAEDEASRIEPGLTPLAIWDMLYTFLMTW
jgi:hypothetical protein